MQFGNEDANVDQFVQAQEHLSHISEGFDIQSQPSHNSNAMDFQGTEVQQIFDKSSNDVDDPGELGEDDDDDDDIGVDDSQEGDEMTMLFRLQKIQEMQMRAHQEKLKMVRQISINTQY